MLEIFEHYVAIAGETGISPLIYCFALQCQQSLSITSATMSLAEKQELRNRIDRFLNLTRSTDLLMLKSQSNRSFAAPLLSQGGPPVTMTMSEHGIPMASIDESSLVDLPDITHTSGCTTSVALSGADGYDALFEEMVTSFPSSRCVKLVLAIFLPPR
jgi:hypothetical protein